MALYELVNLVKVFKMATDRFVAQMTAVNNCCCVNIFLGHTVLTCRPMHCIRAKKKNNHFFFISNSLLCTWEVPGSNLGLDERISFDLLFTYTIP